jgi:hypothetical protein
VCVLGQTRPNFGTNRFGLVEDLYFIVLENITLVEKPQSISQDVYNAGFLCVMARTRPHFSSNRFGLVEDL